MPWALEAGFDLYLVGSEAEEERLLDRQPVLQASIDRRNPYVDPLSFVQVELQYGPFKGFDMHEDGAARMVEMKQQIDAPIAQLIRDLDERGMLERTLVVVATEFGRTIANQPKAGVEPIGFAESQSGERLVIEDKKMYGFHGHFSSANCMLFFGGGFKPGLVYGSTADRHPMIAVENPVALTDVHATIYQALGIAPDTNYVTEGRPFYVTKDGKGRAIDALLA